MRVNRYLMPLIVLVGLLGTVIVAQALGLWATSGRASVNLDSLTPADIKGWMTLQQVADGLGVPLAEVYAAGGVPADIPPTTALKDLEALVEGFETSAVRDAFTGPAEAAPSTESFAPTPTLTPTPLAATEHQPNPGSGAGDGAGPTPLPPGQILPASQIKGRMTLQQVSDQCGVELAALLVALNLPTDVNPNTPLKDMVSQGVLDEVSAVQTAVAALQRP